MSGVPYHQSIFDLLNIQPPVCPEALAKIEECESKLGARLPESVRQWCATKDTGDLWYEWGENWEEPLDKVLRQFRGKHTKKEREEWGKSRIRILSETQHCAHWYLRPNGSEDPPVEIDQPGIGEDEIVPYTPTFFDFLLGLLWEYYCEKYTPISEHHWKVEFKGTPTPKPYLNGLWLFASRATAVAPPYIDFLKEKYTEDEDRELAPSVRRYRFRNEHGSIKITTDSYETPDGKAVWWLHADSEDGLEQLAKSVLWCGDLSGQLRCHSEQAKPVMKRLTKLT